MRNPVLAVALCLVAAAWAGAEEEQPPALQAAHNQVVRFLELSPEQAADWDELYADHKLAEEPLQESLQELEAELEELFGQTDPDPAAVGELVLERRELAQELAEVHRTYHESVLVLLDEDQEQRLLLVAQADRVQRVIPAFKTFELIPRRP